MTLQEECEQSFYQKLYDYQGIGTLYLDETTGRIWLEKIREVYNLDVYQWLKKHRNLHIPEVIKLREEDGRLYVLEEFIQGRTLQELLQDASQDRAAKINYADCREILLQVCDGVLFLHNATPPIIHRDIKPSNIMVSPDGVVKLIDFDAAKIKNKSEARDTMLIGTQGTAAPEQYGFGASSEKTDIYGIGILIRTMFPDDKRFLKIADHATRLEPQKRYRSVKDLRKAIESVKVRGTDDEDRKVMRGNYMPASSAAKMRSGWLFAILEGIIILIAVVAIVFIPQRLASENIESNSNIADGSFSVSTEGFSNTETADINNQPNTGNSSVEDGTSEAAITDDNKEVGQESSVSNTTDEIISDSSDSSESDNPGYSFENDVITTPDYTIRIVDWKILQPGEMNNFDDVPLIAFWYTVTNTSGEETDPSSAWIMTMSAIQDNDPNRINEINVGILPDETFIDTQSETIKKGGTVENAMSYELDDLTTPVILVASDGSNEFGRETFDITQQGTGSK